MKLTQLVLLSAFAFSINAANAAVAPSACPLANGNSLVSGGQSKQAKAEQAARTVFAENSKSAPAKQNADKAADSAI